MELECLSSCWQGGVAEHGHGRLTRRGVTVADSSSAGAVGQPPEINTHVPQTARIWNYWLGGKDNFDVDRQVGDQILEAFPAIVENARLPGLPGPRGPVPGR
jgi:hypothetical protein